MRVLVAGGAGFIGSHVVDLYLAHGDVVAVVDNLASGSRADLIPAAGLHEIDIRFERLLLDRLQPKDGLIPLRDRAGIGLDLDRQAIERFRIG